MAAHYYEYYEDGGNTDDEDNAEDDHVAAVEVSLGDVESSTGGMSPGQVVDITSNSGEA